MLIYLTEIANGVYTQAITYTVYVCECLEYYLFQQNLYLYVNCKTYW